MDSVITIKFTLILGIVFCYCVGQISVTLCPVFLLLVEVCDDLVNLSLHARHSVIKVINLLFNFLGASATKVVDLIVYHSVF